MLLANTICIFAASQQIVRGNTLASPDPTDKIEDLLTKDSDIIDLVVLGELL
jgi:hypothetical protein